MNQFSIKLNYHTDIIADCMVILAYHTDILIYRMDIIAYPYGYTHISYGYGYVHMPYGYTVIEYCTGMFTDRHAVS